MTRASRVCPVLGCAEPTSGGACPAHLVEAETRRGTARQRGYGTAHERRFRPGVLARDPVCVECRQAWSTVADHWPLSRRELEAAGLDPDNPDHGRGLCKACHDTATTRTQPGGWHRPR